MSFIGIITNSKNEQYVIQMLSKSFPIQNIVFITEKNIMNIKNITFETILIDKNINNKNELKSIISRSKYLVLNSDLDINLEILNDLDLTIVTYGFNSKSTLTVSSVSENSILICLQRILKNIYNEKHEPQEVKLNINPDIDINFAIGMLAIVLIYGKISKKC